MRPPSSLLITKYNKEFPCLIMREAIAKGAKKQNQVQFQILSALRSARFCGQGPNFLNSTPNCASSGYMYLYVWYVWHNMQCNGMRQGTSLLELHQPSSQRTLFPASFPLPAHSPSSLPASLPPFPLYLLALGVPHTSHVSAWHVVAYIA